MRIWKKGLLFLSIHTPSKFRIYFNEIFNTNVLITRICFYRDELYIINELRIGRQFILNNDPLILWKFLEKLYHMKKWILVYQYEAQFQLRLNKNCHNILFITWGKCIQLIVRGILKFKIVRPPPLLVWHARKYVCLKKFEWFFSLNSIKKRPMDRFYRSVQ